jgi:hypothetical protein
MQWQQMQMQMQPESPYGTSYPVGAYWPSLPLLEENKVLASCPPSWRALTISSGCIHQQSTRTGSGKIIGKILQVPGDPPSWPCSNVIALDDPDWNGQVPIASSPEVNKGARRLPLIRRALTFFSGCIRQQAMRTGSGKIIGKFLQVSGNPPSWPCP